ncbi:hypothetical protein L9F63_010600, partial [Diploptera punctata]
HRTDEWFLMGSPWPCVTIICVYIYFVKTVPQYMKGRPAFKLEQVKFLYNILELLCCTYILTK